MMKIEGLIIVSVIFKHQINVKLIMSTTKYYFHVSLDVFIESTPIP